MRRKPPIRYVDMAIYIDKHILDDDADIEKIYDYLTMLSYMLAVKRRFFNREEDYDKFSKFFANIVYMRMTDPRQFNDENSPNYITPIKSCLNYMKQIIYARKCVYTSQEYNYTTTDRDLDSFKEYSKGLVISSKNDLLICDIDTYFSTIDRLVRRKIYNGVYGNDKVLCWKLYTSCLISLLRNFTLSNKRKLKLRKTKSWNYDCVLQSLMLEENIEAPITYDLDSKYLDYIAILIPQIKNDIINDIRELSKEYTYSDDLVEDILMSSANFNGDDDDA